MCLIHHLGGAFTHQPEELKANISTKAGDLIKRAFDDLDPARLVDYHTHVAGLGTGGSGAFVNPKMLSWRHPFHRLKFKVYVSAAGVEEEGVADQQVINRLVRLVSNIEGHGKYRLLAFDANHHRDGTINLEKTEFFVPNDLVLGIAEQHPDLFEAAISVNPYRADAIDELTRGAVRGARMVKWLPNAMGIDPSDELCDPFF